MFGTFLRRFQSPRGSAWPGGRGPLEGASRLVEGQHRGRGAVLGHRDIQRVPGERGGEVAAAPAEGLICIVQLRSETTGGTIQLADAIRGRFRRKADLKLHFELKK